MTLILLLFCQNPITLEGEELLKSRGEFTAARTAPRVDVLLFSDLPAGGRQTLWSSWGDGLIATNGRYYTAIGDHRGFDATSRVYEYDPAAKSLKLVLDIAKAIDQKPGRYGHGKIHAALHEHDGWIWFATYWGKPREIDESFEGSILMRFQGEQVENLGAIAPRRGLPASHFDSARGLLYFHAVTPGEGGGLLVYDVKERKVRFQGGDDAMEGKRAFLRDAKGRVYFSAKDGTLGYYDPETNRLGSTKGKLPGGVLRAGARHTKEGLLYGMTQAGRLFVFDPAKQEVKDLGPNFADGDYTAVMVLSPDEKHLYFAPGAHGSSVRSGTPVVQYEIASGTRKVICFLNEPLRKALRYNIGGSYNLQIDSAGERLYLTFNGADLSAGRKQEAFGRPCVVVVHIPASER